MLWVRWHKVVALDINDTSTETHQLNSWTHEPFQTYKIEVNICTECNTKKTLSHGFSKLCWTPSFAPKRSFGRFSVKKCFLFKQNFKIFFSKSSDFFLSRKRSDEKSKSGPHVERTDKISFKLHTYGQIDRVAARLGYVELYLGIDHQSVRIREFR